jgi:glycosyltransferase involved in cell wall biosynthesis
LGTWLNKQAVYLDKYLLFPLQLRWMLMVSRVPTLIHITDQGMAMAAWTLPRSRFLVTCHDLIAIKQTINTSWRKRSVFQTLNRLQVTRAASVVCVSQKTLADCQTFLSPCPPADVVLNPIDPEFLNAEVAPMSESLPPKFLFHVGNSHWYKNRLGLLNIYAEVVRRKQLPLVLLGAPPTEEELARVTSLKISDHVKWLPNPSHELVRIAYDNAEALIFPSLEEGFGWPVLEAMARGCLVFTSQLAPLTEVGGDYAVYLPVEDWIASADVIVRWLEESSVVRQERIEAARDWAHSFSQEKFISQMHTFYCALRDKLLAQ